MNLTQKCKSFDDLYKLNNNCKIFITGSDQVFNKKIINNHCKNSSNNLYLLDFVKTDAKKISYSGSIGNVNFKEWTSEDITMFEYYLKQFNAISVREDINVDILKSKFNIDSTSLIDGAFHIPRAKLDEMTKDYDDSIKEDYIFSFCLPYRKESPSFSRVEKLLSEKYNLPIKKVIFDKKFPVEEWLALIKNAKFVISDSFHAIVFSIIYNVPFVQIIMDFKVQNRIDSLYRLLQIKDNSISRFCADINIDNVIQNYDWEKINKIINEERNKAENWMREAVQCEISSNHIVDMLNYVVAQSQINNVIFGQNRKILKKFYNSVFKIFNISG